MDVAKEPEEKRKFTVYAYKPMYCEVDAASQEEATKLAIESEDWTVCDETGWPTEDDIYDVTDDEADPSTK